MTGLIMIGVLILLAVAVLGGAWLLASALADPPEDVVGKADKPGKPKRRGSLFGKLKDWLHRKPPRLYYQRDKLGRFRKIRRG